MNTVDWYFDYISPFAYFALKKLNQLPADTHINPIPTLFAGLLNHFDTKGPAEIEPMRQFTYRHTVWLAKQNTIPFQFPPEHPFNPLKLLRLTIVLENDLSAIEKIFEFVWAHGKSSDSSADWAHLCASLNIEHADEKISQQTIKQQLISNTQQAIEQGVFGVPTFIVDKELFFGQDAMAFLSAYLDDKTLLQSPAFKSVDILPQGTTRKT